MGAREKELPVAEMFYSIQGEGHTTGCPAYFIRLTGCNLMCGGKGTEKDGLLHNGATWRCDSIEVWRQKPQWVSFLQLLSAVKANFKNSVPRVIITGGEPLMHSAKVVRFIEYLHLNLPWVNVEVETNGTMYPSDMGTVAMYTQYNVSPKLSNSGEPESKRIVPHALNSLAHTNSYFKFVVSSVADVLEAERDYIDTHLKTVSTQRIMLMPAASTREELNKVLPLVAEICKDKGYVLSNRLHLEIWDKKTGV